MAGRSAEKPFLVWTDPGCLLHLIVRSAAAEIPEACSAIELIGDGVALRSPDAAALTEPFLANAGTGREAVLLLDLLLRAGRQVARCSSSSTAGNWTARRCPFSASPH